HVLRTDGGPPLRDELAVQRRLRGPVEQPEEVLTLGGLERLAGAAGALHALREAGERPGVVIEPGDDLVGAGTEDLRCLPDPLHVTRREADPLQSVVHGRHAPAPCPWAARS